MPPMTSQNYQPPQHFLDLINGVAGADDSLPKHDRWPGYSSAKDSAPIGTFTDSNVSEFAGIMDNETKWEVNFMMMGLDAGNKVQTHHTIVPHAEVEKLYEAIKEKFSGMNFPHPMLPTSSHEVPLIGGWSITAETMDYIKAGAIIQTDDGSGVPQFMEVTSVDNDTTMTVEPVTYAPPDDWLHWQGAGYD